MNSRNMITIQGDLYDCEQIDAVIREEGESEINVYLRGSVEGNLHFTYCFDDVDHAAAAVLDIATQIKATST